MYFWVVVWDFFYQQSGTLSRASFLGLKRYFIYKYIYAYIQIGLDFVAA